MTAYWRMAVGRVCLVGVCVWSFCFGLAACSIPNLETAACAASRPAIREFYSFHFGNEMRFGPDSLKLRERFLSAGLVDALAKSPEGSDPFTVGAGDLPKAFRVGECREISATNTEFQVLLFWKDDRTSEQRIIHVGLIENAGKWLVDKVETTNK